MARLSARGWTSARALPTFALAFALALALILILTLCLRTRFPLCRLLSLPLPLPPLMRATRDVLGAGPGSRVAGDLLKGRQAPELSQRRWTLKPGTPTVVLKLPIPVQGLDPLLNGRNLQLRLHSSSPVALATLAAHGDGHQAPDDQDWIDLLNSGELSGKEHSPTPRGIKGKIIYSRVSGVQIGSRWQARITDPGSETLSIQNAPVSWPISSLERGSLGTAQVQTAELQALYPQTAWAAHGWGWRCRTPQMTGATPCWNGSPFFFFHVPKVGGSSLRAMLVAELCALIRRPPDGRRRPRATWRDALRARPRAMGTAAPSRPPSELEMSTCWRLSKRRRNCDARELTVLLRRRRVGLGRLEPLGALFRKYSAGSYLTPSSTDAAEASGLTTDFPFEGPQPG